MVQGIIRRGTGGFDEFFGLPIILRHAFVADHKAAKEAVLFKSHRYLATINFVAAEYRASVGDILAVILGQRPTRHAHAGMELVIIMNALRSRGVQVGLHDHTDILTVVLKKQMLHLSDIGKANVVRIRRAVALHLGEIKRHLRHAPRITPTLNQRFHARCVDTAVAAVARALAPDRAPDGIRNHRRNLAVEKLRRPAPHAGDAWQLGTRRNAAALFHRLPGGVLPLA